jgi:cysteinyl-tRNA synthetase
MEVPEGTLETTQIGLRVRGDNLLKLFNTLGKKIETFRPVRKEVVTIFTCGPSVYQKAHIGNFRTFLFEDILARYLEYSGYSVRRGMNFTDIEDKSIKEAEKRRTTVDHIATRNIHEFLREMNLLRMKKPDYLPRASECIGEAVDIIEYLLACRIAYWYKGNVYFDPLRYPGFGRLYGLDMAKWPSKKRRFHKDTYPGMHWNMGDFILWHGYKEGEKYSWDTRIGRGRPSWNVQDPSMISKYFKETLSIYCGGIDNLFRHHDYTLAILESVRPYPMARFWLHCQHLFVEGRKMSKSTGNILYTDSLQMKGYNMAEIRFFLTYGHYRERIDYSYRNMEFIAGKLRTFKKLVRKINSKAGRRSDLESKIVRRIRSIFAVCMDDDLNLKKAFDGLYETISGVNVDTLKAGEAAGIIKTLKEIDEVFKVIF